MAKDIVFTRGKARKRRFESALSAVLHAVWSTKHSILTISNLGKPNQLRLFATRDRLVNINVIHHVNQILTSAIIIIDLRGGAGFVQAMWRCRALLTQPIVNLDCRHVSIQRRPRRQDNRLALAQEHTHVSPLIHFFGSQDSYTQWLQNFGEFPFLPLLHLRGSSQMPVDLGATCLSTP